MRNLRNLKHTSISFPTESNSHSAPLTATAWDGSSLLLAFGPTPTSPTITLKRLSNDSWSPSDAISIASWDAPPPTPDIEYDTILSLHTLPDTGSICLILAGGDIIVVREEPQSGEDLIEIVGSVDAGISAAGWSPDEELLIIATKANTLLFMTREFEGTATIELTPQDLEVSNHVDVGWGKKETQFKGRGAKAMRDPTVPEQIDEGKLSELDDSRTTISWRGDGQYVAINSLLEGEVQRRLVRVYSREGVLESVSEPVDGLEAALSWKPSGQIIAGIQRRGGGVEVVFFEKNGLRHGEFDLRMEKDLVDSRIDLCWNSDSSVLAVSMKDRVQLWTMGNYHYYLKQEILIAGSQSGIIGSQWHPEKALQLACHSDSNLRMLDHTFEVAHGSVAPPHDHGVVAVIDGKRLKITPLRTANVPPPMAFDEVDLEANALDVAINRQGTKVAILHQHHVSIWTCDYAAKPAKRAKFEHDISLDLDDDLTPRHLIFNGEQIVVSTSHTNEQDTRLRTFGGQNSEIREQVCLLFTCSNHDRILYQTMKGEVHGLDEFLTTSSLGKLPARCVAVEIWQSEDYNILFGLTAGGILHVQTPTQTLKISSCTSFLVSSTHLIYTTSSHLLKFIHLHAGREDLSIPPDEPETDERCRTVERGAKLVTVMPSAYSLVLQMPRGNLETIYPRALVLAGIRKALGQREYKKAFLICRTQRVDMNILHDYAPEQFMQDVNVFVSQLKKTEYVDLVLSSLSEEDVSKTIYKDTIKLTEEASVPVPTTSPATTSSKVNGICDAFLKVFSGQETTHLQSIVTAHVSKNPPDLSAGLTMISSLRKQSKQTQLEQAVEHICFLADVNQLYDTALSLYDLDVALLVAQQSQKDPREYLPYLQRLRDMPPLRQKFSIDDDLKRYPKALTHLHALSDFDEFKTYVVKHNLYTPAIEAYRYDTPRLTELLRLFADFNSSRNRYKEAGIAYEYIGDHTAACEAYRAAGEWRECLSTALLVMPPLEDWKVEEMAQEMADSLEEAKDFKNAATIYLEHLKDLEGAVRMLCRAYCFADAMRLVALRRRPELLASLVDTGLVEASASMTEMLAEMKSQLLAQIPRLRELRIKKLEDPMAFLDGGVDAGGADIPDNISLAPSAMSTSAGTFMTRYTNNSTGTLATNATRKTSKNRRREERKRARGKKGTVYEEEYLVNSVERLVERWNSVVGDGEALVEGLMRRAMRERAAAVEGAMKDVREACEGCLEEVFGESGVANADAGEVNGEAPRIVGGEGVMIEAYMESQRRKVKPTVKTFEKCGLLG